MIIQSEREHAQAQVKVRNTIKMCTPLLIFSPFHSSCIPCFACLWTRKQSREHLSSISFSLFGELALITMWCEVKWLPVFSLSFFLFHLSPCYIPPNYSCVWLSKCADGLFGPNVEKERERERRKKRKEKRRRGICLMQIQICDVGFFSLKFLLRPLYTVSPGIVHPQHLERDTLDKWNNTSSLTKSLWVLWLFSNVKDAPARCHRPLSAQWEVAKIKERENESQSQSSVSEEANAETDRAKKKASLHQSSPSQQ